MSHYSVVAILPKHLQDPNDRSVIEDHLNLALAPYDENVDVDGYEEECYCVSRSVSMWVVERMHEQFGEGVEAFRKSFIPIAKKIHSRYRFVTPSGKDIEVDDSTWASTPDGYVAGDPEWVKWDELYTQQKEEIDEAWKNHLVHWKDAEANYEIEAERLGIRKPDPTCGFYDEEFLREYGSRPEYANAKVGDRYEDGEGCGGTGKRISTYNPQSKWDWWMIGGRWDGGLAGLKPLKVTETCEVCGGTGRRSDAEDFGKDWIAEMKGCNGCHGTGERQKWPTDEAFESIDRNVIKMADAALDPPYAIVTPEGEWIGQGKMGWWGISVGNEGRMEWQQKWDEIRATYPDHYAVQLDCHI